MAAKKKVFVCCPGNGGTGGHELLHQLVDAINNVSGNAYILYYPFEYKFDVPKQYKHYNLKIADFFHDLDNDSIVVLPEVATRFIPEFSNMTICIWWLSVDNYFGGIFPHKFIDKVRHVKYVLTKKKKAVRELGKHVNIVQSEYAHDFLKKRNIDSFFISDYLNKTHLNDNYLLTEKENIIVYNPKKGFEVTKKLMKNNPGFEYIPIQNMSPTEVRNLLEKAKIYIDFGTHPGKDRFPREAAMAGCCVITGLRGSAANNKDVPIPISLKFPDNNVFNDDSFHDLVCNIFDEFDSYYHLFSSYREYIKKEHDVFLSQVESFISKYC
ncbi:hypothetical protein [Pectobacterium versatile]|uniref:hypothetical protein n=1 Tax=Pectobacterium versatile TaxID=2488639 RepID=UPI001B39C695|nr:hypothetical protein [Pectobacterium versatile]MBQ4776531.1 hypothetical protein [Pectobacterium versatile]